MADSQIADERTIRILHVDDDPCILSVSKEILMEQKNFEVINVTSVDEARRRLLEENFDAIVSDYEMPTKNGLEFLTELRENKNEIPFILFTGKGREEVVIKALNLGANGYVNKQGDPATVYRELTHHVRMAVEKSQVENALRDSEAKHSAVVNKVEDGVFIVREQLLEYVNESLAKMLGYSVSEMENQSFIKFFPPENREFIIQRIKARFAGEGVPSFYESKLQCKNGAIKDIELSGTLIQYGGKPADVGIVRDITERKKAEEKLRLSEEKYRNLVENARDIIATHDLNGKLTSLNKAVEKYGLKEETILGRNILELIPEKYCPQIAAQLKQTAQGIPTQGEAEAITPLGKIKIEYKSNPVWQNSKIIGVQTIIRDISERKQSEERLQKLNRALRTISKSNQALIHATNDKAYSQEVCKIVAQDCGYELVWVGFAEQDPDKSVKPVAYAGFDKDYLDSLEITWADTKRGQGPTGTSIRTGKPYLSRNILTDPNFEPWREQAVKKGYTASIALPLISDGKTFGALSIYSNEPDPFSEEEVNLLSELASDFAYGIKTLRLRAEKEHAEAELKSKEHIISSIYSNVPESLFSLSVEPNNQFRFLSVNKSFLDVTGLLESQVVGKKVSEVIPEPSLTLVLEKYKKAIDENKPVKWEETTDYPAGRKIGEVTIAPVFDSNGKCALLIGNVHDITERKKTEEALRLSEETNREIIDGMNDAAWVFDFNLKLVEANNAAVKTSGYSKEELLGQSPKALSPTLTEEQMNELFGSVLKDQKIIFEAMQTTKSGNIIPVEVNASLLTYKGKQAVLAISRDITERKHTEQMLKSSEERLRAIISNAPIGIATSDSNRLFLTANASFCNILGYSEEELRKLTFKDVTYPEDFKESALNIEKLYSGQKPFFVLEKRYVRKDGRIIFGKVMVNAIRDKDGKPTLFVVELEDITETKEAKLELEEKKEILENVAENIDAGLALISKNYEVVWANSTIRNLGVAPYKKCYQTLARIDHVCHDCGVKKVFEQNVPLDIHEYRTVDAKGETVWIELRATPLKDKEGNVTAALELAVPITERKRVEELLRQSEKRLKINNEKLHVISGLARHDVRNKLAVISASTFLLKKQLRTNPELLKRLEEIDAAVTQSDKLFEFSRVYERIGVEEPAEMDVEDSFKQAASLISCPGIEVVNKTKGLNVLADSMLREVFYNLIDNSLKHGKTVTQIRLHYKQNEAETVLFYEDNGVGIAEEHKGKIFTDGVNIAGRQGLGLRLVKRMVEAYGWTIRETGVPGKGAQFVITIPRVQAKTDNS